MKVLFLLICLVCHINSFSQKRNNFLKDDTTAIIGLLKPKITLHQNDLSCSYYVEELPALTKILIYAIKKCSIYGFDNYYSAVYRGNTIAVDTADVYTASNIYDSLKRMDKASLDRLYYKAFYADTLVNRKDNSKLLAEIDKYKNYGIIILNSQLKDESEYTDGTGYSIEVYNIGVKTIKYITINVVAYNPVKDKVFSSKYKSYTATLRGVGPINPSSTGSYSFDYVWFSDLPETSKIISIKLQFMDNTVKTITDIERIKLGGDIKSHLESRF
ncbi:MAG: hypothetical protein WDN26_20945 [Chitinophagaceae bacterium]